MRKIIFTKFTIKYLKMANSLEKSTKIVSRPNLKYQMQRYTKFGGKLFEHN